MTHRTLLGHLVGRDPRSLEEIIKAWNALATNMGENATCSVRQLHRWMKGEVKGRPQPAASRVSERMWGHPVEELLGPPPPPPAEDQQIDPATVPASDLGTWVMATARDSGDHANRAARYVEESSIEDVQERVHRIARSYASTADPLTSFGELLRTRDAAMELADDTSRPSQEEPLYLVLSQTSALLAGATFDLGYPEAAKQHARAAFTYARVIQHTTALAFARATQATLDLWAADPQRGLQYARQGLELRPAGTVAVRLHSVAARCLAVTGGYDDEAREHLQRAEDARGADVDDMCDGIGGQFAFSTARMVFSAGSTHLALRDGPRAAASTQQALDLYAAAAPGDRWHGGEYGALADHVAALVLAEDLDRAEAAVSRLMSLPVPQRTEGIVRRVNQLALVLGKRRYAGTPAAQRMVSRLRTFAADSARKALPPGL